MPLHAMFDLEALGDEYGAVIIAIGAIRFDPYASDVAKRVGDFTVEQVADLPEPGLPPDVFYVNVSAASHQNLGGQINAKTVMWWLEQSDEARAALKTPAPVELKVALNAFRRWYIGPDPKKPITEVLWSHLYDIQLIRAAYRLCGYEKMPWGPRDWGDLHTLFRLSGWAREDYKRFKDEVAATDTLGTKHNAFDDARRQARMVQIAYAKLYGSRSPYGDIG